MKSFPCYLMIGAGAVLAGCASHEPDWSGAGASSGPAYSVTTGTTASGRLDRDTLRRLQVQSPQTYARVYQRLPLGPSDISALSRAGASDEAIIAQISATHSVYRPSAADVIDLHNSGVSDRVIDYMTATSTRIYPTPPPEQITPSQTIIVNQA